MKIQIVNDILINVETQETVEFKNLLGLTVVDYDNEQNIISFEYLP